MYILVWGGKGGVLREQAWSVCLPNIKAYEVVMNSTGKHQAFIWVTFDSLIWYNILETCMNSFYFKFPMNLGLFWSVPRSCDDNAMAELSE